MPRPTIGRRASVAGHRDVLLSGLVSPGVQMFSLPPALKLKLPFLIAGFASFLFSVWLYFVQDEELMGIFVGLWVPSIHSLGTLLLAPTIEPVQPPRSEVAS